MRSLVVLCLLGTPVSAQIVLGPPLDCELGETCFIQQYPDADAGTGAADFTGGPLTYDGHKGTDFRIADIEALDAAPPVVASADGTVLRLRDDVPNGTFPDGRDCGNGLVIDHGEGLTSQLCHLATGSIEVDVGDIVTRGQPVGRIGMTGSTAFPHVHITVRRDGAVIDPMAEGLWEPDVHYEPGGLLSAGFSAAVPAFDSVKNGTADAATLAADDALVLWGHVFGARAGDRLRLEISDPNGRGIFEHVATLDRTQAVAFRAAGRRPPASGWEPGVYVGTIDHMRNSVEIDTLAVTIPVR